MFGIIVFHKVLNRSGGDRFAVDEKEFTRIMDVVKERGNIIKPWDLGPGCSNQANSFIISFDDGTADQYELICRSELKDGFKAVFFISTDAVGKDGFLSSSQIRKLQSKGHVIGSHSRRHICMTSLDSGGIMDEVEFSVKSLEDMTGNKVEWFAPPEGVYDRRVAAAAAKSGIKYFRTTDFGWNELNMSGGMQILKAFNISGRFLSGSLRECLTSKFSYYGYYMAYGFKNSFKKHMPGIYRKTRSITG